MSNSGTGREEGPSDQGAPPAPAPEEVAELQEMLLAAVLGQEALSGSGRSIVLPDIDFVLEQDGTLNLSEENLFAEPVADDMGRPIRVLSVEELRREADRRGQLGYLRFQPAEGLGDSVRLTLEGRIARQGVQDPVGLSGVQATFVRSDGRWRLEGEPAFFAA